MEKNFCRDIMSLLTCGVGQFLCPSNNGVCKKKNLCHYPNIQLPIMIKFSCRISAMPAMC